MTAPTGHQVGIRGGVAGSSPVIILECSCGWTHPVQNSARAVKAAARAHQRNPGR